MSSEEMLGKHCQEIFQCAGREPECGVVLNKAPSPAHGTVRPNTGNGMKRLVVMGARQIFDDQGQLAGAVATIRDIAKRAAPQCKR